MNYSDVPTSTPLLQADNSKQRAAVLTFDEYQRFAKLDDPDAAVTTRLVLAQLALDQTTTNVITALDNLEDVGGAFPVEEISWALGHILRNVAGIANIIGVPLERIARENLDSISREESCNP